MGSVWTCVGSVSKFALVADLPRRSPSGAAGSVFVPDFLPPLVGLEGPLVFFSAFGTASVAAFLGALVLVVAAPFVVGFVSAASAAAFAAAIRALRRSGGAAVDCVVGTVLPPLVVLDDPASVDAFAAEDFLGAIVRVGSGVCGRS